MQTRCPECKSTYKVSHAQLMAAHGLVRCGHCHTLFDGKLMILWAKHEEDTSDNAFSAINSIPVVSNETPGPASMRRSPDSLYRHATTEVTHSEEDDYDIDDLVALFKSDDREKSSPTTIPVLLNEDLTTDSRRPRYSMKGAFGWSVAILIMLLLLPGQYLFFGHIEELSRYPIVQRICESIECDLPLSRDLSSIELLDRGVFTHPNVASALMITATIRNNALFPQPFPDIQVSLADLQGEIIALRRFKPVEYLPEAVTEDESMQPGISHSFKLEVRDPGTEVLAYVFDFF